MKKQDHAAPSAPNDHRGDISGREREPRNPDRPHGDPRHPTERRTRTWSPWLVIRYKDDDQGRVRPIPPGEPFWISPDIEVKSSVKGKAVAGEPNTVVARVINLGKADGRPTRVDFYWADPSLGLGPAQMNYIGTKWIQADSHRATIAECPIPWVPIMVNGGHECLFVNCTSPILNDKLKYPFQPQLDRRAAQRNVTVINAAPGQMLPFWLMVNNIAPMMAKTTITVRTAHLAVSHAALSTMSYYDVVTAAASFRGEPAARTVFREVNEGSEFNRSAPLLRSGLSERGGVVPSSAGGRFFANLLLNMSPGGDIRGQAEGMNAAGGVMLHEVLMDAFEQRRLHLELGVPANAGSGDFIVFDLTQNIAGLSMGGYTVVLAV